MPGEDSPRIPSALVLAMGTKRRAAYGQGSRMRTCRNHARVGAGKVASRLGGGCEDNAARRVCRAGWQLSNRRWAVYLPQQCNLGTPSRSTHGTNHSSAAKGRMASCDRECVRTATARKRSFRTGGGHDVMRARRRRWQIRVRAGATCEVRWARQKLKSSHALQRACGCVYTRVTRLQNKSA